MNPFNKTVSATRKRIFWTGRQTADSFKLTSCRELFFTESLLERNETRDGNLLLSDTVCAVFVICRTRNLCQFICGIQRNTENFWN